MPMLKQFFKSGMSGEKSSTKKAPERRSASTQQQGPEAGIVTWYTPQDVEIDVVFVHGLGGSNETTWTNDEGVCWPKTRLPTILQKARISGFAYESNFVGGYLMAMANRDGLRAIGDKLFREVATMRRRNDALKPIIFIGHSLGGLVIQEAWLNSGRQLDRAHGDISRNTKGMMFLATPMLGSALAERADFWLSFAELLRVDYNSDLLQVLRPDSQKLDEMQQEFATAIATLKRDRKLFPGIQTFAESTAMGHGTRDYVVTARSARMDGWPHLSLAGNHTQIAKCMSHQAANYRSISTELEKWVERVRENREVVTGDPVSVDTPASRGTTGSQAQDGVYNDYTQYHSTVSAPTSGRYVQVGNVVNSRVNRRHDSDDSDED